MTETPGLPAPGPTPAEQAWEQYWRDRKLTCPSPSVRRAFLAGFDAGFEQAAVNPPPPEGPGGY